MSQLKNKIEECFKELENEYVYGGGETEDGELEPGVPSWEKEKEDDIG